MLEVSAQPKRIYFGIAMELAPRKSGSQFKWPKKSLTGLDPIGASKLIGATADIALIIDAKGIVRDMAFGSDDLAQEGPEAWLGRAWIDTVTVESQPKIAEIIRDAAGKAAPRWRQVNHPSPRGPDLPIRYSAVQVNADGRIVAVGRDLRSMAVLQQRLFDAQQSLEREYAKLNHGETRYRLLFQISTEAVLIADATTQRLIEINPAADRLLSKRFKRTVGRAIPEFFEPASFNALQGMLETVRYAGKAEEISVRLVDVAEEHVLAASLFRQDNSSHFLLRLSSVNATGTASIIPRAKSTLLKVVEQLPDGFVVTDPTGQILTANTSFLDMAQLGTEEQARSLSLAPFIGEPGIDFNVIAANLREHGSVRNFATRISGQNGAVEDVEITAVSALDGEQPCLGFTIRGRRATKPVRSANPTMTRSVEQLTELVGRVPLKDLVRESTDIIERLCIEAALELTNDNRASAADMLGLSRQSLYVKLRRYGLGELDEA
jgi:transcriptional regulator PpsR